MPGRRTTELASALAAALDDEYTRAAVTAERAVLAALEAGCSAPVGALADVVSDLDDDGRAIDRISLRAVLGTDDGALLRASATRDMDDAEKLGRRWPPSCSTWRTPPPPTEPLDRQLPR